MHVVVGTGTVGTRFVNSEWPFEEGLIAGTTAQDDSPYLEEVGLP